MKRICLLIIAFCSCLQAMQSDGTGINSEPDFCSICRDVDLDRVSAKNIFRAPCGHRFCKDCMHQWEKRSDICPLCRGPLDDRVMIVITINTEELKRDLLRLWTIGLGAFVCYWAVTSNGTEDS